MQSNSTPRAGPPFHLITYHVVSTRSFFIGLSGAGMSGRAFVITWEGGKGSGFSGGQDALWVGILVLAHRNLETLGPVEARSALSTSDERLWVSIKGCY